MNLSTLILSDLNGKSDQTGYDLSKRIKEKWNSFWSASHQQVYRELNRMEETELLVQELEPQDGKPDRIKYSLTDKGREELKETLQQELKLDVTRDKLAVMLFAASNDEDVIGDKIKDFAAQCEVKRLMLLEQSQDIGIDKIHQLIIQKQLFEVEADIKWSIEAVKTLKLPEAS